MSLPANANSTEHENDNHTSTNMIFVWVGVACGVVSICAIIYYYSRRKMNINEVNIQRILSEGRVSPQMIKILQR